VCFLRCANIIYIEKSKATLVTDGAGIQSCEMLRMEHLLGNWLTDGDEVASLTHCSHSTTRIIL
jgi:hypothetical protein